MTLLLRAALAAACAVLIAGCAADGDEPPLSNPFKGGKSERELRLEADGLYKLARRSLDTGDFPTAIQRYDQILLRYPFTDYATQSQLELIYAKYRSFDPESALSTADRFLKEHPRHPAVDYVYYLRGLVNFERGDSMFDWLVDSARQDVTFARRAFDDFALLAQKFPNSRYAADARLRMVFLRNRIAEHELSVVKYYDRRGAHVAAAKRAEKIVAEYPGAPVTVEALALLEKSYREVGLVAQADDIRRLREANPDALAAAAAAGARAEPKPVRGGTVFSPPVDPLPVPPEMPHEDFGVRPGATIKEISPTTKPQDLSPAPPPAE